MKESSKQKRAYVAPTVTDHGDLRELTKGGGSGNKDNQSGATLKTKTTGPA